MDEMTLFEERFEGRVRAFARTGVRPVDAAAVAHAVVVARPARVSGAPVRWLGVNLDRRAWAIAVALGLLVAMLGASLLVGAHLLLPRLDPAGVSGGLIMVAPDEGPGEIRVIRPDGLVQGVFDAGPMPPGGCYRALVADGERVAAAPPTGAITITPLDGSDPVVFAFAFPSRLALGTAFSPDGTRLAYLSGTGSDRSDLTVLSLVDGEARVVARDLLHASLSWDSWSIDDTLAIGYSSDTESGVDLIQADGGDHRVLVRQPLSGPSNKTGMLLSWSSDGTHLAYAPSSDDGEVLDGTRVIEVATGRSTVLATADGTPVDAWRWIANHPYFLWSPDGRTVVYPTETGLTLLDLATGDLRTLADPHGIRPFWSPDGSRIAFLTNDGSAFQPRTGALLSSVPPGTTDSGRLTVIRADLSGRIDQDVAFGARHLAWSPDGQQIAVLAGNAIDLHDPDAKQSPTRISSEVAWSSGACFSWSRVAAP